MSQARKKARIVLFGGGKQRECGVCGETYFRRNLEERWYFDAPGVWTKRVVKVCTGCSTMRGGNDARIEVDKPAWIDSGRAGKSDGRLRSVGGKRG